MRSCVIFNPTARGDKAKRFRRHLDEIGAESALKQTSSAGDARRLAAEAVREGMETIVAAGGDGTVNEVLNGIGDASEGFERSRLGVLPLGTVNVFARELGIPAELSKAWDIIRAGQELRIDLPRVDYSSQGVPQRHYFAQLGGAGLDARAIELVRWELKKKIGPLAYVLAGMQALFEKPAQLRVQGASLVSKGGLILIGNGKLYGGTFRIFPKADLQDGLLDLCVFPQTNWFTLLRCTPGLLGRGRLAHSVAQSFQTDQFELVSDGPAAFELDGELIGHLPARFSVERRRLRVVAPKAAHA